MKSRNLADSLKSSESSTVQEEMGDSDGNEVVGGRSKEWEEGGREGGREEITDGGSNGWGGGVTDGGSNGWREGVREWHGVCHTCVLAGDT